MVSAEPSDSLVGKLLDERYELVEVIGDGGLGTVYRARQINLDRTVAVKVLHEALVEQAGFAGRFRREAAAMSRLYHPHCVGVIDTGAYESRPYLVLEFLPGQTIRQLLAQGPFEPNRAVYIALQLLDTLEYFHSHHVIHRDLKSENVMLVESSGAMNFVKVLDFGMAKIMDAPGSDSQLSKIGIVPGTPSAMAPEQIYQLPPDPRIDIYATGILLYEMIVGSRPFNGPDIASVVQMQISSAAKPPREVLGKRALSAELEQVIMKALEKDRVDRFGTAGEMAAALRKTREARAVGGALRELADRFSRVPPSIGRVNLLLLGSSVALTLCAALVLALWPAGPELEPMTTTASPASQPEVTPPATPPPDPPPTPSAAAADPPAPAPRPDWQEHRAAALRHASLGERDAVFAQVKRALEDGTATAAADPTLAKLAVSALDGERLQLVLDAFRSNPELIPALREATAHGETAQLRHTAYAGLRKLDAQSGADLIAMRSLDVKQATACAEMREAWKHLRKVNDPRVKALKAELRARGRKDRHVRCLKRWLR